MHEALDIRQVRDDDIPALIALWQSTNIVRPWNDPGSDIDRARRGDHSRILVGVIDGQLVASIMVGEDGHRGWVYYVAIEPAYQKCGVGRAMMKAAEDWLKSRGVAKLNLLLRSDNADAGAFYERLGYQRSDVICLQKSIIDSDDK